MLPTNKQKAPRGLAAVAGLVGLENPSKSATAGILMATSRYVQTPEDFFPAPWLERTIVPRAEALSLFAMVGRNGETLESVRELIAIPPRIERRHLLYAEQNPEDAQGVERVLQFRRRVAEEFDRLMGRAYARG